MTASKSITKQHAAFQSPTIIATWNVNSLKMRLSQVLNFLKNDGPDLLALQETKTPDECFPQADIEALGYHVVFNGQRTYNGVATISKKPLHDILKDLPHTDPNQKRFLATTIDALRIINLYVPNGASIDSDKYTYKLAWLEQLRRYLKDQLILYPNIIILGDFNIAPEDQDVYDPIAWKGQVLVSDQERLALKKILALGFSDTFRLFEQPPKSYSWWDYRQLGFQRNHGLRLDLILASKNLVSHCKTCTIDRALRKLEKPSDHAPVILTIE